MEANSEILYFVFSAFLRVSQDCRRAEKPENDVFSSQNHFSDPLWPVNFGTVTAKLERLVGGEWGIFGLGSVYFLIPDFIHKYNNISIVQLSPN